MYKSMWRHVEVIEIHFLEIVHSYTHFIHVKIEKFNQLTLLLTFNDIP